MKRNILRKTVLFLLFAVLLCTALPQNAFAAEDEEPGELPYVQVTDEANKYVKMSTEDYLDLVDWAETCAEEYGFGVYLLYITDYAENFGEDYIADLSDSIIDYYGAGGVNGGILLLIDCELREYDIYSWGKRGAEFFPDGCITDIENSFLPYLKNNDWFGAGEDYMKACARRLRNYDPDDDPYAGTNRDSDSQSGGTRDDSPQSGTGINQSRGPIFIVIGIVSLLAALITCSIMKKNMKSAALRTEADEYIPEHGSEITVRQDIYTHTTETRRKIETNSSGGTRMGGGGGGGSSHHSGHF